MIVAGHEHHAFDAGDVHELDQSFRRHIAIQMPVRIDNGQNVGNGFIVGRSRGNRIQKAEAANSQDYYKSTKPHSSLLLSLTPVTDLFGSSFRSFLI